MRNPAAGIKRGAAQEGRRFSWLSAPHFCILQQLCGVPYIHEQQGAQEAAGFEGVHLRTHKGGSGHLTVRRGSRKSQLPVHGSSKQLGTGLVNKILKDLGLE